MREYSFEKLEIWQLSRKLAGRIYLITREFPDNERFGLISQVRRASISVSSNIAEGSSRYSTKDRVRFIEIGYGSLMEVASQLIIAMDLNYLEEDSHNELRELIEELSNKMNSFRKAILKN